MPFLYAAPKVPSKVEITTPAQQPQVKVQPKATLPSENGGSSSAAWASEPLQLYMRGMAHRREQMKQL